MAEVPGRYRQAPGHLERLNLTPEQVARLHLFPGRWERLDIQRNDPDTVEDDEHF